MAKYHMNKKEREIKDEKLLIDVLRNGKFAVISMCRDNEPYIVTLSYGYDSEKHALYIHSSIKGLKLEFIQYNPNVCGTVIQDKGYVEDECEQHYRSVVLFGKMYIVDTLEEKKYGLNVLLDHLEKRPEPIKNRNVQNDDKYNKVAILRLDIDELTGKEGA